jgi:sporulation integral membrane protein YtvI
LHRSLWLLAAAGATIYLTIRVRAVLTPFLFAAVIAYLAYPVVQIFEQRFVPRPAAILLVYAVIGTVLGVAFWVMLPQLVQEMDEILAMIPSQTEKLEDLGQGAMRKLERIAIPRIAQEIAATVAQRAQKLLEDLAARLAQGILGAISHLAGLLLSPVLAFYMLRDHEEMRERLFLYIPLEYRTPIKNVLREVNRALNGFFRGQLLISGAVGLLIYIGLSILKVRYALFIGFIAGLFDIIPYFGPIIGFIPAAAFALLRSPISVLWVLAIFVLANQLESSIIAPKIIGDRVGLHPLAVIFAVLVGGELLGITGMLVAVPAASIVRVLLHYFLVSRHASS